MECDARLITSISPSEMLVELRCEEYVQGEWVGRASEVTFGLVEVNSPWSTYIQGKVVRSEGQNGDSHHLSSLRDECEKDLRGFGAK